jgi:hypothetical protein
MRGVKPLHVRKGKMHTCRIREPRDAKRWTLVDIGYDLGTRRDGGNSFAIALVMLRPCLLVVNACRPGVHRGTGCHQRAAPIRVVFRPYRNDWWPLLEPRMGFVGAKEYPLKGVRTHSSGGES